MKILGVSALYHDSAAALVEDGKIVVAAQEERFNRIKNDANIPAKAIKFCLAEGQKISNTSLDYVVFYDLPLLRLDRYIKNILALGGEADKLVKSNFEKFFLHRLWIHQIIKNLVKDYIVEEKFKFIALKHHLAHAASAFYPSPFEKSVVLTVDGVGEWTTLSLGIGDKNHLECKEELRYPHSLGLFYSALSHFCGFKVNSGEYKFMGLAPYGEPRFCDIFEENVLNIKEDGSFQLNLEFFNFQKGTSMLNEEKFIKLTGGCKRLPEANITRFHMDIAASTQKLTEKILLRIIRHAKKTYGTDTDCLTMAGGVALNCVANGKILQENIFKNIWIQPAAGDAGAALGAALYFFYHVLDNARPIDGKHDSQHGSFLGVNFSENDIETFLQRNSYVYHREKNISAVAAKLLNDRQVIGLFQNRMEFGPRALGARSIIADARLNEMQTRLNLKIKFRESFRPFAPAVLKERVQDYFDVPTNFESPYMLFCLPVKKERRLPFVLEKFLNENNSNLLPAVKAQRSDIPAVTHVDYSARLQTVAEDTNPHFYKILKAFEDLTGCGVLVNTSFNLRGEPIVCTPKDACECFMKSNMDALIIENFILYKAEQINNAAPCQESNSRRSSAKFVDLETEKLKILEWAQENFSPNNFLAKPNSNAESFFTPFDNSANVIEYEFQTLPELKALLLQLWQNEPVLQKIALTVSVAAFKSKPIKNSFVSEEMSSLLEVPDFIYEF